MKKKKVKSREERTHPSYALGSKKSIYGIADDFILIVGGSFLLVIFGIVFLAKLFGS
jgi:hypothetical protein